MGWPSAPLRRGPDRLEFWSQGTMLKVAPVSTKYLSFVNSSVRKIKPAFAGKCKPWQWHVWGKPPNQKGFGGVLVFRPRTGRNAPVSPIGVVIVKFAHVIARVLEGVEIWMGRGATFRTGVTAPFVASLPAAGSGAHASLCRGGFDRRIVAAPSVP
jgi:hypothetical protein